MLTYSFDERGDEPLYEYLYRRLREDILAGRLARDTRLPSRRSFAANLGVSVVTVENAYAQLLAEGYIYSLPKSGYFVSDAALTAIPPVMPSVPSAQQSEKTYRFDLTGLHSGAIHFPLVRWSHTLRGVLAGNAETLLVASPPEGLPVLRRAIADHLKAFRGMEVPWERIVLGSGTEYLYGLVVRLLGTDRVYAAEDPGYSRPVQVYRSHGARCVRLPIDSDGIRPEDLDESGASVVHITPSHHFPTGRVMPARRRIALLNWAYGAEERCVIEDDYDSELRLTGRPIPSLHSIDTRGRVIYMNTFSKTLTSALRVAYMVLPEWLLKRFHSEMSYMSCTVPNFEQYTLAEFIADGSFEKHLNRMRTLCRGKRDHVLACLKAHPRASEVSITEEDAGLHFLMKVDTGLKDEELLIRAEALGLRIETVSEYASDGRPEHTLIVNYAALRDEEIPEAVETLMKIF